MKHLNFFTIIAVTSCFISTEVNAKIKLPSIFTDNMVLQQQTEAPIWGEAKALKQVKLITSWDKKEYTTKADESGKWKIAVQTPSFGGPYEISISDGATTKLKNVMIGEVWICSGQSNMEMPLAGWGKIENYKEEIANANYPDIRLFQVKKTTALSPSEEVIADYGWVECSPNSIAEFSSVGYFFARDIHLNQNVPIGVINSSWGGTIAEAWTSGEMLYCLPDFIDPMIRIDSQAKLNVNHKDKYYTDLKAWNQLVLDSDRAMYRGKPLCASLDYDDNGWKNMSLPNYWESQGLDDFDGIVWFRKTVDIPQNWENKELNLHLGMIDDNDITYFNNTEIGKTDGYNVDRIYKIPADIVKSGKAVVTVRVEDTMGDGGIYDQKTKLKLSDNDGNIIDLDGKWLYSSSLSFKDIAPAPQNYESPNRTSVLYNAMISPLIPFSIKGAIWYQGESNASRAYQYRELFPQMIRDWRNQWDNNFPFYFVQLANFRHTHSEPGNSDWAELREAQFKTLSLENTGMAVTIDIGDADDIHPKNKQEVGRRLALIARANTYNEEINYSGPIYDSYKIENQSIRIKFKYASNGLKTSDGNPVTGFAVAGPDHKFYWANAVIEGDEIIVSSENVKNPIAVRYAWATNPVCNLINEDNLPASPFRTDDWPGLTFNKK